MGEAGTCPSGKRHSRREHKLQKAEPQIVLVVDRHRRKKVGGVPGKSHAARGDQEFDHSCHMTTEERRNREAITWWRGVLVDKSHVVYAHRRSVAVITKKVAKKAHCERGRER